MKLAKDFENSHILNNFFMISPLQVYFRKGSASLWIKNERGFFAGCLRDESTFYHKKVDSSCTLCGNKMDSFIGCGEHGH